MRIIIIVLIGTVLADVSHLVPHNGRHYLPPKAPGPIPLTYRLSKPKALPVPPLVSVPRSRLHTSVADLPLQQRLFIPASEDAKHQAQASDRIVYSTAPNSVFHTQINVQSQGSEFNAPNSAPTSSEDEDPHGSGVGNFPYNADFNSYPRSMGFNDLSRQLKFEHKSIAGRTSNIDHNQERSQVGQYYENDRNGVRNHHNFDNNQRFNEQESYHNVNSRRDRYNDHSTDQRTDHKEYHTGKRTFDHIGNKNKKVYSHNSSRSPPSHEHSHRNYDSKEASSHENSDQKQSNYQGLNLIKGDIAADQEAHLPKQPPNFYGNTQDLNIINENIVGRTDQAKQGTHEEREHHDRLDRTIVSPSASKIIAFNKNNLPLPQIQTPLSGNDFDLSASAPEVIYKSGDEIDFAETKLVDYGDNRQPLESYRFSGQRGPKRKTQRAQQKPILNEEGYHYDKPRKIFNS